jgi:hypothetical protein
VLSASFVSEITERISIKFGIEGIYTKSCMANLIMFRIRPI